MADRNPSSQPDKTYVCVCVSEMLGQCVYTAYKARRCLLHTDTQCSHDTDVRHATCLRLCNRASRLLSETIAQLDTAPNNLHITKVWTCTYIFDRTLSTVL